VRSFLKRLTTRNLEGPPEPQNGSPLSALALNSSGKILSDLLLYKQRNDSVFIELDSLLVKRMMKRFQKYSIRQDVSIRLLDEWQVYVKGENDVNDTQELSDQFISFRDPRDSSLGNRIWTPKKMQQVEVLSPTELQTHSHNYYVNRCFQGVPEGYYDLLWEKSVPWESNYDVHKGVDLGFCFMGQELTARSFHTGVFRRRMMGVRAIDENGEFLDILRYEEGQEKKHLPKHGETIRAEGVEGRFSRMGRMGGSQGSVGLCLLKTKEAREGAIFYGEESGLRFKAIIPDWLDEVERAREARETI